MSKNKYWAIANETSGHKFNCKYLGEEVEYDMFVIQTPYNRPTVTKSNRDILIDDALGCIIGRSTDVHKDQYGNVCTDTTSEIVAGLLAGKPFFTDRCYEVTPRFGLQLSIKLFGDTDGTLGDELYQRIEVLNKYIQVD